MRLSARTLLVLACLVGAALGDLDESSDRLDDFSDISLDDNESEPSSDLSHLSDDEFLAGEADAGPGAASSGSRPGEVQAEKSAMMLRVMGATLKRPGMTQRFGQILPIIRVMSPPQRLALVSLVMQQAMVPEHADDPPLQMAMKLGATPDGKSNLTSQLLLPLSADIAHIFRGVGLQQQQAGSGGAAAQPGGQVGQGRSVGGQQQQGAPYRPHQVPVPRWQKPHAGVAAMPPSLAGPRAPPHLEPPPQRPQQRPQRFYGDLDLQPPPGANRRSGHIGLGMRPPPPPPGRTSLATTLRPSTSIPRDHHGCSLFSDTVCASVDHYPEEAILASMDADRHTVDALLSDKTPPGARSVAMPEMQRRQDDDYPPGSPQDLDNEGQDGGDDTHLCASVIKYARPQRARATSGQWKFIVNTAEHTQTLRLEKCTRLDEPCNYMPDKVRSHCTQVYNYHRLLTWDKEQGLHIDIFKVPTCCSCQVLKSPFLTSSSPPRRPGGYAPNQHLQQPIADFSQQHETVVTSESGRPVSPQYTLKPFNQQIDETRREPLPASKPSSSGSSKPTWPFRRAATRRPPVQGQGLHGQYGLQTLEESAAPGDLLPQYPPLQDQYTPLAGRRTGSARNRTRLADPDDLTAEGTVRRAAPAILHPDGSQVAVRVPAAATATSKRPLPPVLPPRLETYRPRATTAATTAATTPAPAPIIIPTSTVAPGAPHTPTPKRVNYSYHPIIDFFRPLEKQMSAQEPRHAAQTAQPVAPPQPPPPPPPQLQEVAEQRTAPDDAPLPGPSWSAQQGDWSPITKPSKR